MSIPAVVRRYPAPLVSSPRPESGGDDPFHRPGKRFLPKDLGDCTPQKCRLGEPTRAGRSRELAGAPQRARIPALPPRRCLPRSRFRCQLFLLALGETAVTSRERLPSASRAPTPTIARYSPSERGTKRKARAPPFSARRPKRVTGRLLVTWTTKAFPWATLRLRHRHRRFERLRGGRGRRCLRRRRRRRQRGCDGGCRRGCCRGCPRR